MQLHQSFNLGIAIAYGSISLALSNSVIKNWHHIPPLLRLTLTAFALFIAACGTGHGLMALSAHGDLLTISHGVTFFISAPIAIVFPLIAERLRQILLRNHQLDYELRQNEAMFHLFLDAHPSLLAWIKDENLAYTYTNQTMLRQLGAVPLGGRDDDWLPPEVAQVITANDLAVMESGNVYEGIEIVPDRSGVKRHSLVYKFLLETGRGRFIGGTATDITEQEHLRHDMELAFRELETFTHAASHDLKTPLRGISGLLAILERKLEGKLSDYERKILTHIQNDCSYAIALVDGILTYSKVGQAQTRRTAVDMGALLAQVCGRFTERLLALNGSIHWHDESMPLLSVDQTQIQQVFSNLIDNALKYRSNAPPEIKIGLKHQAGTWVFSVADNGIGVDPAMQNQLFVMFSRLHNRSEIEGTGIGLATVKKIAQRHGGNAWIESDGIGCGSTVYFSIRSAPQ